jgi:hypothetical protein
MKYFDFFLLLWCYIEVQFQKETVKLKKRVRHFCPVQLINLTLLKI